MSNFIPTETREVLNNLEPGLAEMIRETHVPLYFASSCNFYLDQEIMDKNNDAPNIVVAEGLFRTKNLSEEQAFASIKYAQVMSLGIMYDFQRRYPNPYRDNITGITEELLIQRLQENVLSLSTISDPLFKFTKNLVEARYKNTQSLFWDKRTPTQYLLENSYDARRLNKLLMYEAGDWDGLLDYSQSKQDEGPFNLEKAIKEMRREKVLDFSNPVRLDYLKIQSF